MGPKKSILAFVFCLSTIFHGVNSVEERRFQESVRPGTYQCDEFNRCLRERRLTAEDLQGDRSSFVSLAACRLTCDPNGFVWPRPSSGVITIEDKERKVVNIRPQGVRSFDLELLDKSVSNMIMRTTEDQVLWLLNKGPDNYEQGSGSSTAIKITFNVTQTTLAKLTTETDEAYKLAVVHNKETDAVDVSVYADNFYGVRHALETLFQLMDYDDVNEQFIILTGISIEDEPHFKHRGLTLDTSRNFITVEVIKRILDGMSASKLNVFHWHITDSHSFPVELKGETVSQMSQVGAYCEDSVYSQDDIKEIVDYANLRGILVIPELDQPAHVGHGWQLPGWENYTVCIDKEPWYEFCVEPPCGQLNPTEPGIYDVLESIYEEFLESFDFDTFHMGADEVHFGCWNSSSLITDYMKANGMERTEENFIKLWSDFQEKSSDRLKKIYQAKNPGKELQIIVWTSHLTNPEYVENLPKDQYTIQIWGDTATGAVKAIAEKGYRMIVSNWEKLYLDCGFGAWVGKGNNWCSPYKGWQEIYENDVYKFIEDKEVEVTDEVKDQILGAEAAMWTEQADSMSVEAKIFPRVSALGERLWTNPETNFYEAEARMIQHREVLSQRGINAERLQPEWCRQNGGQCYVKAYNPLETNSADAE